MAGQILSQFRRVTCSQCHCRGYFIGKEMLEGTWEHDTLHESLAQYLLLDFTLENSKTTYIFSGQKKPFRECGEGLSALRLWKPVADFPK